MIRQTEEIAQHHKKHHDGLPINTGKLSISSYSTEKDIDFDSLKDFHPVPISSEQLKLDYLEFKKAFKVAVNHVRSLKIFEHPTLLLCLKHMYCGDNYSNFPWNIKQFVLRLVTVQTSEAVCETWGSVMEKYHDRFTHSDLDDEKVQAEMFVNLSGPSYGDCVPFLEKCLEKHGTNFVLNERAKYFSKGKTITKMLKKKSAFPFHKYL